MEYIRPPRLRGHAADVYASLAPMIMDLLLGGSTDVVTDVITMLAELGDPAFRECARENVCRFELGSVMTTALLYGPSNLTRDNIWPHGPVSNASRVRFACLAEALRRALARSAVDRESQLAKIAAAHGNTWGLDVVPRKVRVRGTKRPRDPERDGFYRELVRDEVFAGRAPKRKVVRAARLVLLAKPKVDTVEAEMKRIRAGKKKGSKRESDRDRLTPIPADFHTTLFARRLRPFLRNRYIAALLDEPGGKVEAWLLRRAARREAKLPGRGVNSLPPSS